MNSRIVGTRPSEAAQKLLHPVASDVAPAEVGQIDLITQIAISMVDMEDTAKMAMLWNEVRVLCDNSLVHVPGIPNTIGCDSWSNQIGTQLSRTYIASREPSMCAMEVSHPKSLGMRSSCNTAIACCITFFFFLLLLVQVPALTPLMLCILCCNGTTQPAALYSSLNNV